MFFQVSIARIFSQISIAGTGQVAVSWAESACRWEAMLGRKLKQAWSWEPELGQKRRHVQAGS